MQAQQKLVDQIEFDTKLNQIVTSDVDFAQP